MGPKDQELLQKLLATFKVEAEEHLQAISSGLLKLEKVASPREQMEIVEIVFREAHSLKGAARAVNLVRIESACQSLESAFAGLKTGQIQLTPECFDQFHQMVDAIVASLAESNATQSPAAESQAPLHAPTPPDAVLSETKDFGLQPVTNIRPIVSDVPLPATQSPRSSRMSDGHLSETLRVSSSKLDLLLRQAEELIPAKASAAQRSAELQEIEQALSLWELEWRKLQPHIRSLEKPVNGKNCFNGQRNSSNGQENHHSEVAKVLSFVNRNQTIVHSLQNKLAVVGKRLDDDRRAFERRVDELLEDAKQVSTIPFSTLLELFPKLVRDLCRDCGKDAELIITGGEIEADRRILEEIKDALIHLIRN